MVRQRRQPTRFDGTPTRTMVLWCPDWPIRALVTDGRAAESDPVALLDRGLVFACSPAARDEGVRRGLRVREAQARCPRLTVLPYDRGFDARAFEPVLTALEQAIPGVQPMRPGLVAIRARGPVRFYGGERAAAQALLAVLGGCRVPDAAIGIADGPFAAEQAARAPQKVTIVPEGASAGFLGGLPVSVFGEPETTELLRRLGVHTLADLAAMNPLELRERFGEAAVRMHAIAAGRDGSTVVPREPKKELERRVVFEPGLDRIDQLTFAVRQTADGFLEGLTSAGLVCTGLEVVIRSESGELSERVWLHPRWFAAADVVDRVRWQLQGAGSIGQGLRSPVVEVVLSPDSVDAIANHESGLWGDGPDERIHHALSRVQSMLGHEAVVTAAVGGGRLLAERQVFVPWGDRAPAETAGRVGPWPGALPPPLPTTVFDPPAAAALTGTGDLAVDVDEHGMVTLEPELLEVEGRRRAVASWAGPWPVEQRWWDETAARSVHRLHVVDDDGMAWLLFLEGGAWRLEARYD